MSQQGRSAFVVSEPSEIVQALVGLKDVRVLYYERRGREVELVIEQVVSDPRCPGCHCFCQIAWRRLLQFRDSGRAGGAAESALTLDPTVAILQP